MKRLLAGFLAFILFVTILAAAVHVAAAPTNLIANPSVEESSDGTTPNNWSNGRWGDNTAQFIYDTTGHTGSRSLKTVVTAYTSGDAKWFFKPVAAAPSTSYTYNDFYLSDVTTRLVIQYQDTAGAMSYSELDAAPASASWNQYQAVFTTPANVAQMTIFHLVSSVGTLSVDDAALFTEEDDPVGDDIVPNNSLETAKPGDPSMPDKWKKGSWGDNTATFSYPAEGRTGSRSVKVSLSNYVSGDGKWYFTPVTTLQPGSTYTFTTWYKSNILAQAVVMWYDAGGTEHYLGLPNASTINPDVWQPYRGDFTLPAGAVSVSVFMLITGNGWLQTDDYSIKPFSVVGFNRGLVSLTFDDGWKSIYNNGLPLLQQYGLPSTQYVLSGEFGDTQYMTKAQMKDFLAKGHEIASHSIDHKDLTTLPLDQLDKELKDSQATLRRLFGAGVAGNFATPYGSYNPTVVQYIKKYYRSHRSVDEGYNSKDYFDIYNIRVQNIEKNTTNAEVASWVAKAKADKTWLVLVYHQVVKKPGALGDYDVTAANLDVQLKNIKNSGITVKTVDQALDELVPQL